MISAIYKLAHINDIQKLIKFIFSKRGAGDSSGTNLPDRKSSSFWEISLETVCIPAPGKTEQLSYLWAFENTKIKGPKAISQKEGKSEIPETALKQFYLL